MVLNSQTMRSRAAKHGDHCVDQRTIVWPTRTRDSSAVGKSPISHLNCVSKSQYSRYFFKSLSTMVHRVLNSETDFNRTQ